MGNLISQNYDFVTVKYINQLLNQSLSLRINTGTVLVNGRTTALHGTFKPEYVAGPIVFTVHECEGKRYWKLGHCKNSSLIQMFSPNGPKDIFSDNTCAVEYAIRTMLQDLYITVTWVNTDKCPILLDILSSNVIAQGPILLQINNEEETSLRASIRYIGNKPQVWTSRNFNPTKVGTITGRYDLNRELIQ
jgi:hypothetical protein